MQIYDCRDFVSVDGPHEQAANAQAWQRLGDREGCRVSDCNSPIPITCQGGCSRYAKCRLPCSQFRVQGGGGEIGSTAHARFPAGSQTPKRGLSRFQSWPRADELSSTSAACMWSRSCKPCWYFPWGVRGGRRTDVGDTRKFRVHHHLHTTHRATPRAPSKARRRWPTELWSGILMV